MAKLVSKYALCLHPESVYEYYDLFSLLQVNKRDKYTSFNSLPLTEENLQRCRLHFKGKSYGIIDQFCFEAVRFSLSEQKKNLSKQKLGGNLELYLNRAILRQQYEYIMALIPEQENFSLYHKILNEATGNYLIRSCRISNAIPKISFKVIQLINGMLTLEVYVEADQQLIEISHFNRDAYLLQKENVYYLLKPEDAKEIDAFEELPIEKYGKQPHLFLQHIVKKLEQKYSVDKGEFFESKIIDAKPVNCIYLSELNSGAYLMITPQWKYENILIEGNFKPSQETTIDGQIYLVNRIEEAEKEFREMIRRQHPNFEKQNNDYFYLTFDDAKKRNWFLNFYHNMLERDVEWIGMDMLQHFRYSTFPVETHIDDISTTDNIVTATFTVQFGTEQVDLRELQKILNNGQRSVLLNDNTIGVLDDDWMIKYETLLKHAKINKDKITIPKWLLIQSEELKQSSKLRHIIGAAWWQKWDEWQKSDKSVIALPKKLHAELRPYQHKGFEWICLLGEVNAGACLADDMGLGKTLQTIAFLGREYENDSKARFIVVCPSSLIYNWKNELQKFYPDLDTFIYQGSNRKIADYFESTSPVLITTYATLRNDIDELKTIFWNTIVIDESHNIKSIYALSTKAVYEVLSKHKIALSGTPVMNQTFDLYAQLNYLLPGFLGSQEFFRNEYALPIDRNRSKEKMEALHKLTAPFILRRTKQQVATDLPEKTELTLFCEMGEEQREAYELIKAKARQSVFLNIKEDGLAKSKLNILQAILKLRQVCCAPVLAKDDEIKSNQSIKLDVLMDELLNNLSDNKVLVFSQFKDMLHLIAAELQRNKIPYFHFDGDTAITERQKMVAAFQEEGNTHRVFLMSLKTGNAGINLTAADYVFLIDPWWNTAIQQQAIDRTHRIGQTKNVFAYKMICKDTIEEKIIAIQSKKEETSSALVVEDENFVKNLSQEDVAFLFS